MYREREGDITPHYTVERQYHCPRNAMYYMFSTCSLAAKCKVYKTVRKENENVSYKGKMQMYTKKLRTIKHVDPLPWQPRSGLQTPMQYLH